MNVIILGEDQVVLDLVAHFMGIAVHDNLNSAPSSRAPRKQAPPLESLGPSVNGTCQARFAGWPTGMHHVPPFEQGGPGMMLLSSA